MFRMDEEMDIDTEVGRIEATDKDIGDNAKLTYSLIGGHLHNDQIR